MSEQEFLELPPEGMKHMIVPPNIEGMMAGASYAEHHSDGRVRVVYLDGSDEWSKGDFTTTEVSQMSFLAIVSAVQGERNH